MFSVGNDEEDENSKKIYIPTSIYKTFKYIIKKKNI
jgi:hypothetical protein